MNPEPNPAPIRLDLSVEDINQVLDALGKLPFVSVYQLIARIQQQAQEQVQSQSQAPSPSQAQRASAGAE